MNITGFAQYAQKRDESIYCLARKDPYDHQRFICYEETFKNITIYLSSCSCFSLTSQEETIETIKMINWELVSSLLTIVIEQVLTLTGRSVIKNIFIYNDPDYDPVIRLVVDLDAREALELWLKLVELLSYSRYKIVIEVKWLGKNNVSKDELVNYIVKIMIKSSLRTIVLKHVDAVKELREERDKN
jgi:hypothetical protein